MSSGIWEIEIRTDIAKCLLRAMEMRTRTVCKVSTSLTVNEGNGHWEETNENWMACEEEKAIKFGKLNDPEIFEVYGVIE